jgi:TonB family protein
VKTIRRRRLRRLRPFPFQNGVLNGQALSLPAPIYPESARRMQLIGTVRVEVTVDENGKVISAKAISGPGLLRDASVQAAYRAKFLAHQTFRQTRAGYRIDRLQLHCDPIDFYQPSWRRFKSGATHYKPRKNHGPDWRN